MSPKDYTTGVKVDPNNRFTVVPSGVTINDLDVPETAYIVWDEGVGAIDGDYEYLVDIIHNSSSSTGSRAIPWTVANEVDSLAFLQAAGSLGVHSIILQDLGSLSRIVLQEGITGGGVFTALVNVSLNTNYYLRIKRDRAVGVFGTLFCFVYTDPARTAPNLISTLSLLLHEDIDFRYEYGVNSLGVGVTEQFDGVFSNLERIQAVAAAGRRRRMLIGGN